MKTPTKEQIATQCTCGLSPHPQPGCPALLTKTDYSLRISCKDETDALMLAIALRQQFPAIGDRLCMESYRFDPNMEITLTVGSDGQPDTI